MTGGSEMTIRISVYCACAEKRDPAAKTEMRLVSDVEDAQTAEYRCPACDSGVTVDLRVSNEH